MSRESSIDEIVKSRFTKSVAIAEKDIDEKFDKIIQIMEAIRNRLLKELRANEEEFELCSDYEELQKLSSNKVQIEDMFRDNSQQDLLEDNMHRIERKIQTLKERLLMREVTVKWQLEEFYTSMKDFVRLTTSDESPPILPPKREPQRAKSMSEMRRTDPPEIPNRSKRPQHRVVRMPTVADDQLEQPEPEHEHEQQYIEMKPNVKSPNDPFDSDPSIQFSTHRDMKQRACTLNFPPNRNTCDPLPPVNEKTYPTLSPGSECPQPPLPRRQRSSTDKRSSFQPSCSEKILGMHIERIVPQFAGCNRGKENQDLYKANTVDVEMATSDIYVADTYNHCVKVFDKEGKFKSVFGRKSTGKLEYPFGLCISGKILYVGEKMNGKIKAYQLDGTFLKEITGDGTKRGQFKFLWGISADSENGDIYACDNENDRIQVYTSNLEFRYTIIGPALAGNVTGPVDVKIRNLMIIVLDQGDPCVHYFDKQGMKLWSMVEFKEAKVSMAPQCFTFDIEDNILISDASTHTIRIFTPKGELYIALGKKGEKAGEFCSPSGIALNTEGNIVSICQREKANLQILTYSK